MRAGYRQLSGCSFNLFTTDELEELNGAILDVLEEAGLMVFSDEAQEIFYSHGCKVDKKTKIVKIPPYLVEDAIRSAPSKVLLGGRHPENDVILGGNRVNFTCFAVSTKVLDLETGEARQSTNKDLAEAATLVDAVDEADIFFEAVTPCDVPVKMMDAYADETAFSNTTKHFCHAEALSTESVRRLFEMGVAIMGSEEEMRRRPIGSIVIGTTAPLQLIPETCDVITECARLGVPVMIGSEVLSGATGPVTLAGTLIIHAAEVLGGIVLHQLTKKGGPVIFAGTSQSLDLKGGNALVGDPEYGLLQAGCAKLAQYYNIPSFHGGG